MTPRSSRRPRTTKAPSRRWWAGTPWRSMGASSPRRPLTGLPAAPAGRPSPTRSVEEARRARLGGDRGEVDRLDELRTVVPDVVHEVSNGLDPERDLVRRLEERLELARLVDLRVQPEV